MFKKGTSYLCFPIC